MKTTRKLTFLLLAAILCLAGCENKETELSNDSNILQPTEEEFLSATQKLQKINGWNSLGKTNVDLSTYKATAASQILEIDGYYSDGGTYVVSGNLNVHGCVADNQKIHVVYWLYDYAIQQWKNVSQLSGTCMDEDNLNSFLTYYSNNAMTDFYVVVAAQIYIEYSPGQVSLWNTFYSNVIFLNGPY